MLNERKLTDRELASREEAIQGLLSNKRTLVKKYGKDAEKVMYGIATKQAKSKIESMNKDKLKELIQQSLKGKKEKPLPKPVAKDLNKMKTNFSDLKKRLKLEDTVDTGFSGRADYGEEDKALGQEDELEMRGLEEGHGLNQSDLDTLKSLRNQVEQGTVSNKMKDKFVKVLDFLIKSNILQDKTKDLSKGKVEEANNLLKQDALSPAEYQKAKKLKGFDPKNYKWDKNQELHLIRKMNESLNPEVSQKVNQFIKAMAKRYGYSEQDAVFAIMAALKQRKFDGLDERVAKIDEILDERITYDDILDLRSDKKDLEDRISQLYRDMEQEAEPEGGPIADRYGDELEKLEAKLYRVSKQISDYDMNEATRQDLGMSSSISKSRAKSHLKNPSNDGSKVYGLDSDGKRVELKGLNDVDKFKKFEIDADMNEATRQDLGMTSSVSKRRAKAELKKTRNDGSKVYGLDKDGKRVEIKNINDVDRFKRFELDADLNESLNEAMDGGTLFDYFNKEYAVGDHFESDNSYIVKREPSGKDQYVIFDYDKDRDQFSIRQLGGYRIDQKEAIKAGMREMGGSRIAGIDSYMVDGNYNPVDISIEGLKDIVDHVMGGLSREAKAQQDFYARRGKTSGTIDEKIATAVKEKLTKSSSVEDHVEDFKDSDAPQFKGKSLKKIKQMALASFLQKQGKKKVAEGFKVGQKVTYLGHPAEITLVDKDVMDRVYYNVSYDKGNGKTKVSNIYNKGGEIKAV